MMHFVSKKEAFTNSFEAQRGVDLLGFCILLLNDQAYSFCPLRKCPLTKGLDQRRAYTLPSELG